MVALPYVIRQGTWDLTSEQDTYAKNYDQPQIVEQHLGPAPYDDLKLQDSGQVQWVAQAVRCIREAIGARTYAESGCFTFKRPEVMAYINEGFPGTAEFVATLYTWKCDPETREAIRRASIAGSSALYARFRESTTRIQRLVECVLNNNRGMISSMIEI